MAVRYEEELQELQRAGLIDDAIASRAIAIDRGALFSVYRELRAALYVAVVLIVAGIGILIKQNLDRVGPVAIVLALAGVAALCYVMPVRARLMGQTRSLAGEYLLLLGALLVSADLAYAESQFHWLDARWSWHLLILAVIHGVTAYALDSRLVLAAALASLAAWFGVDHTALDVLGTRAQSVSFGWRAFAFATVAAGARLAHWAVKAPQKFIEVYEHFAANAAFWGALAWCSGRSLLWIGLLVLNALAAASIYKGMQSRAEAFVVYGVGYGAIGYCIVAAELVTSTLSGVTMVLIIAVVAAMLLRWLHERLQESDG